MGGRILFFLGSVFLLSGCKESKQPEEGYNSVSIIEYINTYDANNRIIAAQGTEYDYIYFGENKDKEVLGGTEYRTKKYSYLNDSCYTVEEPLSESLTQITRYTGKTAEELVLENGKDTMHYSFDRYYDRDKPEYEKRVTIFKDEPAADSRYENYYYYDGSGNNTKIVHHDLNTGQREETYKFDGIDYKEAISLVPSSDCKQNIECNFTQIVNDTSITRTTFNGVLSRVVKEYIDGEKKIKEEFEKEMTLVSKETAYEEKGLKVNVNHTIRSTGYSTDSIYCKGNKKVKHIYNSDYNGTVTLEISEYDEQGNVIKKTKKLRWPSENKITR